MADSPYEPSASTRHALRGIAHDWHSQQLRDAFHRLAGIRRKKLGFLEQLEVQVLVPTCADCWAYEGRFFEGPRSHRFPEVSTSSWEPDLKVFGVTREEIRRIRRGFPPVQCRGFFRTHEFSYEDDDAYVNAMPFDLYFEGLGEGRRRSVPRWMKKLVWDAYGRSCFGCKKSLSLNQVTMDHIDPTGDAALANLQPLCKTCNGAVKKNSKPQVVRVALRFPLVPPPHDAYEGATWSHRRPSPATGASHGRAADRHSRPWWSTGVVRHSDVIDCSPQQPKENAMRYWKRLSSIAVVGVLGSSLPRAARAEAWEFVVSEGRLDLIVHNFASDISALVLQAPGLVATVPADSPYRSSLVICDGAVLWEGPPQQGAHHVLDFQGCPQPLSITQVGGTGSGGRPADFTITYTCKPTATENKSWSNAKQLYGNP